MEDVKKTVVTLEGKLELEKEYDRLVHVERDQVIEELKAARSQGDLSENADYDAARDRQGRLEARIKELEYMLQNLEVIADEKPAKGKKSAKTVILGSTVKVHSLDEDEEEVYTIVGTVEANPVEGKISNECPLAIALLDRKVGETVTVFVTHPYKVEIVDIQ